MSARQGKLTPTFTPTVPVTPETSLRLPMCSGRKGQRWRHRWFGRSPKRESLGGPALERLRRRHGRRGRGPSEVVPPLTMGRSRSRSARGIFLSLPGVRNPRRRRDDGAKRNATSVKGWGSIRRLSTEPGQGWVWVGLPAQIING